jgi:hypothetical protein
MTRNPPVFAAKIKQRLALARGCVCHFAHKNRVIAS